MRTSSWLVACVLVFASSLLTRASIDHCGGEPCDAVVRGFSAFFDRKLDGLLANGRACADCHMPTDSFQLSPANVEARFQVLQRRRRGNPDADDPLFRPIAASSRTASDKARTPSLVNNTRWNDECHGGPGLSTPQATPNDPPAPVIRFHNIFSQCPRPVDPSRALRVRGVSATTRAQCAHLRNRVVDRDTGSWGDYPAAQGRSFAVRRPIPAVRS